MITYVVVFGGLAVAAAIYSRLQARKRGEELAAFAATRGWTWIAEDASLVDRFPGEPFGMGSARSALNVITGDYRGRPFVAFDYSYLIETSNTTGSGRDLHEFSVVAIETGTRFPWLQVAPEGPLDRTLGRATGSDIELESEDFNRAFTVTSASRRFASDTLHPRMMEHLMRWPDFSWRLQDTAILTWADGTHTPSDLRNGLQGLDLILDRIPDFVWKAAREGGGPAIPPEPA